eukprot:SAG31_NODE_4421_length_3249_cov_2.958730_5_plen_108_part_00
MSLRLVTCLITSIGTRLHILFCIIDYDYLVLGTIIIYQVLNLEFPEVLNLVRTRVPRLGVVDTQNSEGGEQLAIMGACEDVTAGTGTAFSNVRTLSVGVCGQTDTAD